MREPALLLASYLLGSVSFGTLLVRVVLGVDVRKKGSGSAGATNVLRTAGRGLGVVTLCLDAGKGAAAVLLMRAATYDPRWVSAAGVAVVLGHIFPVWFGFRGGKGVATALGAFLVLAPAAILVIFVVFLLVVGLTRFVSLGSVTAACLLPVTLRLLLKAGDALVLAAVATSLMVVFSHRANLRRLLDGTERKMGEGGS